MTKIKIHTASFPYDPRLLFPVLFLTGIGIVMVYSASSALALERFGSDYYFVKKQAVFALIGIVMLVICRHTPYKVFRSSIYLLLIAAFLLLLAVQVSPIGHSVGGAKRWLRVCGLSFQPSEIARFAMIVYLAYSISKKQEKIKEFSIGFVPHVLVLCLFAGLIIIQPDFGSVMILCALTWIMLFVGGVKISHLASGLLAAVPFVFIFIMNAEYRLKRLVSFLDPWKYPSDEGYQIIHSLMAFGTGGMWGRGLGEGCQKLFYLPEPHTDFIFSVIGEELGLWGVFLILGFYSIILWRGISISKNSKDLFGSFTAIGLTAALGLQVSINMGVAVGLLPTKGLTLPFLSYGGTSLVINMACIGILMNIGASKPS